jgi:methylated-DNA-[protein]-cysteine S-methyltransferase
MKCFSGLYDKDGGDALAAVKTFVGDLFFCREPGRRGIDLDMDDLSEFRRSVYYELMKVPFGELITYGELACTVGKPGGARAVGQAVNKNPFLLLVPCHRVVASGKDTRYELGGFGAGTDVKRVLLRLEGHDENDVSGL